jgi:hypothetical protein
VTIKLPSLYSLSGDNVETKLTTLSAIIDSLDAGIDTSRGPFRDLVLRYQAILQEAADNAITTAINSAIPSLAITSTESDLNEEVILAMANSYGLSRRPASVSSGKLLIVVSSSTPVFIPVGAQFVTTSGMVVVANLSYAASLTTSVNEYVNERTLVLRSDGRYEFTIDVSTVTASAGSNISAGEPFTALTVAIPSVYGISAESDFTGGADQESLLELVTRVARTSSAKTMSTRSSVVSYLTRPDTYPDTTTVSVIGSGDVEMQRDAMSVFPGGNKVDIYVRPSVQPYVIETTLEATVVEAEAGASAKWSLFINRDVFPGFYRVVSVNFADSQYAKPTVDSVTFDVDTSPVAYGEATPAIYTKEQGAFSRFQTATALLTTSVESLSVGDKRSVIVAIEGMPHIASMQSLVACRAYRFATGDTLVRAAFPCFVSALIRINLQVGMAKPAITEMQLAIAQHVNSVGFAGDLYASQMAAVAQQFMPAGATVVFADLIGEYIQPDGSVVRKRSRDYLTALNKPSLSITGRTTAFITNASAIQVVLYEKQVSAVV